MFPSPNVSEIDSGPLTNDSSVFSQIEQGLKKSPDKPAVICMHQPANQLDDLLVEQEASVSNGLDCLSLTYTQLHQAALRLASGLHANGVEPGSKILFMIPNGGEYALLLWTCIVARLTFTSLDPADALIKNTQSGLEVFRSTIVAIQPSAIVFAADSIDPATLATAIDAERLSRRPLLISMRQINTSRDATGYLSLASLARDGGDGASLVEAARNDDPDRLHSIIFTSGTSGPPKGCPLRAGGTTHMLHSWSWLINAENCTRALQQAHNARGIAPANTVQTWREGGAVVMSSGGRGFDIDDLLDAVRRCGVTFVVLTPPMVHGLALKLASSLSLLPSLDSVKMVQLGGDAVTKDVLIKCASMFPRADICINHGMTEGGACFRWPFLGLVVGSIPFLGQVCPVGEVAPGAVARIWDADNGHVVPRRQPGELHLSSNSIIKGYLSGESTSSFYEDGGRSWFITGDVAMMDDDGLVYILGRSKDMIKSPRGIVMPSVIESCIESLLDSQVSLFA
jgi:4-coumarate--CoA ligase